MEKLTFRNTKGIKLIYKSGKLFCNNKFNKENNCFYNKNCTGVCSPENGCSCPECDLILSYAIYAGGSKNCPICNNLLTRENILAISKIRFLENHSFTCQKCKQYYNDPNLMVLACFKCNIKICPSCAADSINFDDFKKFSHPELKVGKFYGQGLFYCGKKYTEKECCICNNRDFDGICGPENGCPCSICKTILEFNVLLNKDLTCPTCMGQQKLLRILESMHPHFAKNMKFGFLCRECKKMFAETAYSTLYYCNNCEYHICAGCIYKKYLKGMIVKYPPLPKLKNNSGGEENNSIQVQDESKIKLKTGGTNIKLKNYVPEDEDDSEDYMIIEKQHSEYILIDVVKKALSINEKKKKEKEEERKCMICNINEKDMVFFPCKHMACCENCHKSVSNCPICKVKIDNALKVFG